MRLTKPLIAAASLSVLLSTPVFAKDFNAEVTGAYSRLPSNDYIPNLDTYGVGLTWYAKPILDSDILPYKELPFLQNASSARASYLYTRAGGGNLDYTGNYGDMYLGGTYFIDKAYATLDTKFRTYSSDNTDTNKGLKAGVVSLGYKPFRELALNTAYGWGENNIGRKDNTDNFWGLGLKWVKPYSPMHAFSVDLGYKRSLTTSQDNHTDATNQTSMDLINNGDPLLMGTKGRAEDYSFKVNYFFTPKFDMGVFGNYVTSDAETINNYGISMNYFFNKALSAGAAYNRFDQSSVTSNGYALKVGYRF